MADDDPIPRDGRSSIVPESIRKALVSGISALFMTEEGIMNMLSDMRLPKDAMAYLMQQTERTRKELFRVVSQELKGFLTSANVTQEVRKALLGLKVQIRAEVRFAEDGPHTDMQAHFQDPKPAPKASGGPKRKRRSKVKGQP